MHVGYLRTNIIYKEKEKYTSVGINRLIAAAFHGNNDMIINHIDGVKNNNNINNLEYVTSSENIKHAYSMVD